MGHPASIMASATPAASTSRHSTSALEVRSLRGLRCDAEGSQVAETVSEAHDLPPRFSHGSGDGRIHVLGRCDIGWDAYFVWALPPKVVGTVQRTVADTVIEAHANRRSGCQHRVCHSHGSLDCDITGCEFCNWP